MSAERNADIAQLLHRITVYGALAILVPVIGLVLAATQGRVGEVWISANPRIRTCADESGVFAYSSANSASR